LTFAIRSHIEAGDKNKEPPATMPSRRLFIGFPVIAAALCLTGIGSVSAQGAKPLNVVSTVGMIADVVENIGGDCVTSTALMGPGIDPHLYRATARDVQTLGSADMILYSGYHLEGQLGDVLGRLAERVETIAVSEAAIDESEMIHVQDGYGIDPHVWMAPGLWSPIVPVIANALSTRVLDCAADIASRADDYASQLAGLDGWARASIATIPEKQRILVTAHDAFAYFGRAYGIEVAGIQGISTESEAGVADIRKMAETVAGRGVPAVFVESTINPRTVQAVIEAAAQAGHSVKIGAELYSDAMGDKGTPGGTYIGMVFENTLHITEALGGTPAPLPAELSGWASRWNVAAGQ
jgi:manganese/zinc/iron transport system substrate-binding protein